jgi:hypothetical protein
MEFTLSCNAVASSDCKFGRVEIPSALLEEAPFGHGDPVLVRAAADEALSHLCIVSALQLPESKMTEGDCEREGRVLLDIIRFHPMTCIRAQSSTPLLHAAALTMTMTQSCIAGVRLEAVVPSLRTVTVAMVHRAPDATSDRKVSSSAAVGSRRADGVQGSSDPHALLPAYVMDASSSTHSGKEVSGAFLKGLLLFSYVANDAHIRLASSCYVCVRECTPALEKGGVGRITPATRVIVAPREDKKDLKQQQSTTPAPTEAKLSDADASIPLPLRELLYYPTRHPEMLRSLNVPFPRGLLLYGPPGVGKTHSVRELGREFGCHVEVVDPSIVSLLLFCCVVCVIFFVLHTHGVIRMHACISWPVCVSPPFFSPTDIWRRIGADGAQLAGCLYTCQVRESGETSDCVFRRDRCAVSAAGFVRAGGQHGGIAAAHPDGRRRDILHGQSPFPHDRSHQSTRQGRSLAAASGPLRP